MDPVKVLHKIFDEVLKEVRNNEDFKESIGRIILPEVSKKERPAERATRRKPGPFDPAALHREAPGHLKQRLEELSIDELKNIVAEHGMDRTRLAMKWKNKDRLVDLIVTTVQSRDQKGDAFRTASSSDTTHRDKGT